MLKLIYTETSLHLELLTCNPHEWVEQRLIFASSIGQTMFVNAQKASFTLPDLVCEPTAINFYLYREGVKTVTVNRCDVDRVEIGLTGYWLSTHIDRVEGIFIAQLPEPVENYLCQLWCIANDRAITSDRSIG
jgi:hypothetical protein